VPINRYDILFVSRDVPLDAYRSKHLSVLVDLTLQFCNAMTRHPQHAYIEITELLLSVVDARYHIIVQTLPFLAERGADPGLSWRFPSYYFPG
jgi:hypothetical protein